MPRRARIPRQLRLLPFRGSEAVARGLLTRSALRSKAWRRVLPDTYLPSYVDLDYRMWCWAAAVYIGPSGVIAGLSAAFLHGIELPRDDRIHVIVPPSRVIARHARLRITRAELDSAEVTVASGVRVTTPARTCFDLGRELPLVEAVVAIDQFCNRRLVTLDEIRAIAGARSGRRGSRQLSRVLDLVEPKSESPMETRSRLVMVFGGLPRPVAQVEIHVNGVVVARLDLAYEELKIGIEYDGDQHRDRVEFGHDLRRQNAVQSLGWVLVRFTATDVYRNPDRMVETIRRLIASRRADPPPRANE